MTAEHWECYNCGYTQNGIKFGLGRTLALGAVIGVGLKHFCCGSVIMGMMKNELCMGKDKIKIR